ncbi:MAG: hypothetical protein GWN00_29750 [Aliifodinibius sp.]|nr:hypothetical protein [Fodinibius sp.]NIY28824.1 hypothetical protein [Fodinibius sp.]
MNESITLQRQSNMSKGIFFLLWIGINIVGWAAWFGFSSMPIIVDAPIQSSKFLSYVGLFIVGGVLGVLQWLLLKREFPIAWYEWTILTIVGFGVGLYSLIWAALRDNYIVPSPPGSPILEWDPLLGGALLGLALGCCQGVVWRPRFDRVILWIVFNVMGWSLGMFLPQLIAFQLGYASTPWLSTLFPVVFAAVVTGIGLVWFLGGQYE